MAAIVKRSSHYRVRDRDPSGHQRSRTFRRKVDAERFAREVEVDMDRGQWIDPHGADVPLEQWAETLMVFHPIAVADDAADVSARPVDVRAPTLRLGPSRPALPGRDRDVARGAESRWSWMVDDRHNEENGPRALRGLRPRQGT
jgi:hypothetical protein